MRILAFDTSGCDLSVALAENDKPVAVLKNTAPTRHSDELVPMLEEILRKNKWKPKDLDVIAVGVGPGSFTGLRVGLATAKMLALVWNKKLVGVPSLEAIAYQQSAGDGLVPVVLDARRGRVYAALYEKTQEGLKERVAPSLTTVDDFSKKVQGPHSVLERPCVSAVSIACAAWVRARSKRTVTAEAIEPLYLHPKDCNVTIKK